MKTSKNTSFLTEKKNVSWQKPIKEWIHFVYLDLKNVYSCKMEKKNPNHPTQCSFKAMKYLRKHKDVWRMEAWYCMKET